MDTPVGISTGAVSRDDVLIGIAVNDAHTCDLVELSSLDEIELPQVEQAIATHAADHFARCSVHGPAKGRALPEAELIRRLAALERDIVMHPDIFEDLAAWQVLGPRLLVENNDRRKKFGGAVEDLDAVFDLVPDAGFCLDVSHAMSVGGMTHVARLAHRYADRLVQLHAGCSCGDPLGVEFGVEIPAAVRLACETAGRAIPVVLERSTPADLVRVLDRQLDSVRGALV